MSDFQAKTKHEVKQDWTGLISFKEMFKVTPEGGGKMIVRIPGDGAKTVTEAILGGPGSAPEMAAELRRMANQLDRAHQDYHFTGSGILRQVMDGIRQFHGCSHLHLPHASFKAIAAAIDSMRTHDDSKMIGMAIINQLSGMFPENSNRGVVSVIQHVLGLEVERRSK
jgi:hypothetical protein